MAGKQSKRWLNVGQVYPCKGYELRVLCEKGNQVMLEKWSGNQLISYVVATGVYFDGQLLNYLNGMHFVIDTEPPYENTQFEAFRKSWNYLNKERYVHVLLADSKGSLKVCVFDDMKLAMQALQGELDRNDEIQTFARNRRIKELTAKKYLEGALCDVHFPIDEYKIISRIMNQGMTEIEEG